VDVPAPIVLAERLMKTGLEHGMEEIVGTLWLCLLLYVEKANLTLRMITLVGK
jgi:hypothetical protein